MQGSAPQNEKAVEHGNQEAMKAKVRKAVHHPPENRHTADQLKRRRKVLGMLRRSSQASA